jgi:hypothetical protein
LADLTHLIQTLIGGGSSLLGGFLSPLLIDSFRNKREVTNLAMAFAGEIAALIRIVETRRYTENIQTCIAQMERTHKPIYYTVTIRQDYVRVYEQNVSRIGLLEASLPENIAMFYTQTQAILEDLAVIDDHPKMEKLGQKNLLRCYKNLLSLLDSIVTLSQPILAEILTIYR